MKISAAAGALVGVSLLLAGCSAPHSESSDGIRVVASTTQICDYVTQLATGESANDVTLKKTDSQGHQTSQGAGSDTIDLTCLLAPNASAHDHEMTAQQMKALGAADLLLVSGVDLEHFLDQAVASSGFRGTMSVTSGKLSAAPTKAPQGYTVDEGERKVDTAPWPFAPEPGEEAEFDLDPHVWTSPRGATIQVENIAAALDKKTGNTGKWRQASQSYVDQLHKLDRWTSESIASVPRADRVLFTSHDAFGYFARDYDVDFIGAALSDFNEQQDASAEHIRTGVEQVKQSHAKVIFAENSNNAKSIEAIARAAGVRVVSGEDALYGDSLGPVGSDGETYVGSILHNVTNLVTAWGGAPADIPAEMKDQAPKDIAK